MKDLKQIAAEVRRQYAKRCCGILTGDRSGQIEFHIGSLRLRCEGNPDAVDKLASKYERAPRAWQKPRVTIGALRRL